MFLPIDTNSAATLVTGVETLIEILLRIATNHNETVVSDDTDLGVEEVQA